MHKLWVALGWMVTACSSGAPPPADVPPAEGAEPVVSTPTATQPRPAPPPQKIAWADMDRPQRVEHMKMVVTPRMKLLFQDFDGEHYSEFGCATCHGPGAKEGKFDMPNPDLPKLDATDSFAAHMKGNEKVTKWMMEKVVPEMAAALEVSPYDPATKQGFGCFDCHTPADGAAR